MLSALSRFPTVQRRVLDAATIPADLASVTSVATREEASPSTVGLTQAGVDAIWSAVERLYATGMHPGISFVLRRRGRELAVGAAIGASDAATINVAESRFLIGIFLGCQSERTATRLDIAEPVLQ